MTLAAVEPGVPVYRLGRRPDPWDWPDWRLAGPQGTFGNRWDDPQGQYRVLYACSERLGTFLETLARFRASGVMTEELKRIGGAGGAIPPGTVPPTWPGQRLVAKAILHGAFADVGAHESLAHLQTALGGELTSDLEAAGVEELDGAAIRLRVPRALTQRISRYVYEQSTPDGRPRFAGIAYRSRLGDDMTNWAIFEPTPPIVEMPFTVLERALIVADDPDFRRACELLRLQVAQEG